MSKLLIDSSTPRNMHLYEFLSDRSQSSIFLFKQIWSLKLNFFKNSKRISDFDRLFGKFLSVIDVRFG